MTEKDFLPKIYTHLLENGRVSCQAPSNIALIKYWGKYGEQLPKNPSISFTLSKCYTVTIVTFEKINPSSYPKAAADKKGDCKFEVFLDGKRVVSFEPKIQKFFERIEVYLPFLKDYRFMIETANSFPHSSGIASSASGLSALALCLMEMEKQMLPELLTETDSKYFIEKASFLARLGSGSACRSINGPLIVWGKHSKIEGSNNLFGIKYPYEIHDNFKNYQDTILLVDKGEKQVSSTVGHNLMVNHPYSEQRFKQANDNLSKLIPVLKNGNLSEFIKIVESEALTLHAMMMTSKPNFILIKPNTLEIINSIRKFREGSNNNLCFTLDAGANVHMLYPIFEKKNISAFIKKELIQFCKNGEYIEDEVGYGAECIQN